MKPRHKRLLLAAVVLAAVGGASALMITALRSNIAYFFSPTQVLAQAAPAGQLFRIGGLVKEGSVQRDGQTLRVRFLVTDRAADVKVQYEGILPDLFKEGKGVVARGRLGTDGVFTAEEVLAKHDENYMPPEVGEALDHAQQRMGGTVK
jgi:cytochrome c-type biogenesis protein CcmE